MSDEVDQAQVHEEFRRELALRAARSAMPALATPAGFGLCEDCAEPIEAERRQAHPGARRCLVCQEHVERRARQFA